MEHQMKLPVQPDNNQFSPALYFDDGLPNDFFQVWRFCVFEKPRRVQFVSAYFQPQDKGIKAAGYGFDFREFRHALILRQSREGVNLFCPFIRQVIACLETINYNRQDTNFKKERMEWRKKAKFMSVPSADRK
jgi:hypothetical protein